MTLNLCTHPGGIKVEFQSRVPTGKKRHESFYYIQQHCLSLAKASVTQAVIPTSRDQNCSSLVSVATVLDYVS